jgi:hypothetical protein
MFGIQLSREQTAVHSENSVSLYLGRTTLSAQSSGNAAPAKASAAAN